MSSALIRSIEIWEDRALGIEHRDLCPLCREYRASCATCPIRDTDVCKLWYARWDRAKNWLPKALYAQKILDALNEKLDELNYEALNHD